LGGRRLHEELRLRNRRLKWNVRQEHGRYLFRKVARLDSGVCLEFVHPGDLDCECRWAQEDRGPEQESVIEITNYTRLSLDHTPRGLERIRVSELLAMNVKDAIKKMKAIAES